MNDSIKLWLRAAATRALKTAAQTAVSILSVGTIMQDIDWMMVASASGLAAILSLLTSVAGLPEVEGGASLKSLGGDTEC